MNFFRRDFPDIFFDSVGRPLETAVSLKIHSYFRIGGNADYFFEALSKGEIMSSILSARKCSIPYYIIGRGSNILFDDVGFPGLIIKNCVKGIERRDEAEIKTYSGTILQEMVQFSANESLMGLDFLAGIPGTVGGAVFGNAGAFGQEIGALIKEAVLIDKVGNEKKVDRDFFNFGYRNSSLRENHMLILEVVFELKEGFREEIDANIKKNLSMRKRKHPPADVACAGSYFKNPLLADGRKISAAFLLDKVGAKTIEIGGAAVYRRHANFIINKGNASSSDIRLLALELKKRVRDKFGIDLEEEVIFVEAGSSMP